MLRIDIQRFLSKVREDEQPFSRVFKMSQAPQSGGQQPAFSFDSSVLQTRHRLLTESLLLRCDYALISDFLSIYQKSSHRKKAFPWLGRPVRLDLAVNRRDCLALSQDSIQKQQPMIQVEARIQFAKFVALERMMPRDGDKIEEMLVEGRNQLNMARDVTRGYPSTAGLIDEIDGAEKMIRESTFYTSVTSAEKQAIYAAMAQDFRGTGHWYYCVNMHLVSLLTQYP